MIEVNYYNYVSHIRSEDSLHLKSFLCEYTRLKDVQKFLYQLNIKESAYRKQIDLFMEQTK